MWAVTSCSTTKLFREPTMKGTQVAEENLFYCGFKLRNPIARVMNIFGNAFAGNKMRAIPYLYNI